MEARLEAQRSARADYCAVSKLCGGYFCAGSRDDDYVWLCTLLPGRTVVNLLGYQSSESETVNVASPQESVGAEELGAG